MRKTLFRLSMIAFTLLSMQNTLTAQEKTPLNQVVNTLKERISLAGYAQLGYTYDDAANPDNTFDLSLIHIYIPNYSWSLFRHGHGRWKYSSH